MASWFKLAVDVPSDMSDRVSTLLFDIGCTGLQVEDAETHWKARLTAFFETSDERDRVREHLTATFGDSADLLLHEEAVEDQNWATAWREHFEPVQATARISIRAPWHAVPVDQDRIDLVIEPRTAFGTGRHPTTRMALEALEALVGKGDRVFDVGTGSGILSIAARKLGAASVTAVDVDPLAEENLQVNLALNGVDGVHYATRSVQAGDTGYDLVVANIISSIMTPMLIRLRASSRPGGNIILGGLLDREEKRMTAAAVAAGLVVDSVTYEAEWIGIRAHNPNT